MSDKEKKGKTKTKKKVPVKKKKSRPPARKTPTRRKTRRSTSPSITINEGGAYPPVYPYMNYPQPYPLGYQPPPSYPYQPPPQEYEQRVEQAAAAPVDTTKKPGNDTTAAPADTTKKPGDDTPKDDDDKKKKKDPHKWRNRFLLALVFTLIGVVVANAMSDGGGGGGSGGGGGGKLSGDTPCKDRGENETTCINGINCAWFKEACVDIQCGTFSEDKQFCNNNTSNQCMYYVPPPVTQPATQEEEEPKACRPKVCSVIKEEEPCGDVPGCEWSEGICVAPEDSKSFGHKFSAAVAGICGILAFLMALYEYMSKSRKKETPPPVRPDYESSMGSAPLAAAPPAAAPPAAAPPPADAPLAAAPPPAGGASNTGGATVP